MGSLWAHMGTIGLRLRAGGEVFLEMRGRTPTLWSSCWWNEPPATFTCSYCISMGAWKEHKLYPLMATIADIWPN